MKVFRDPQIISGFIYEEPVDEIPALTHCGEALCCRGHARPLHSHSGFEFLYLSRGTCHWEVAGSSLRQTMGDLFIAHPQEMHSTGSRLNPENRHIWIGLCLDRLGPDGVRLSRQLRRSQVRLLSDCQEAEPLLHAIISQIIILRPRRAEVVASLLHAFISLIAQQMALVTARRKTKVDRPALPYSFAVQKAIAYMKKNLDRRVPLRDFSAAAMMRNTPHFCVLFHREVGVTPSHYHTQLRLHAARENLQQPSGTITHVALQFGFSSSQHFSTHFRRAFGLTPRQWQIAPVLAATTQHKRNRCPRKENRRNPSLRTSQKNKRLFG